MSDWEPSQRPSRGAWRDRMDYSDFLRQEAARRREERRREYLMEHFGVETAAEAVRKWR